MKQLKHWQDPINALVGVALVLSPWALSFSQNPTPTSNAVIGGLVLIAIALGAMIVPRAWEEWAEAVVGLWLIAAPWALKFSADVQAMRVSCLAGVVVTVLALWVLATDKDYSSRWTSDRAAH